MNKKQTIWKSLSYKSRDLFLTRRSGTLRRSGDMIIEWRHIIVYIGFLLEFCCCASETKIQQQAVKDIYGNPISFPLKDNRVIYYPENGREITAYIGGVEFDGGRDSLSAYLLTNYINYPSYNYEEYNVDEYFFILFDSNLDIKEVRIMHRKYADNKRFYYDNIFIEALKNTTGMWNKTVENQKWYIYLHRQRVY